MLKPLVPTLSSSLQKISYRSETHVSQKALAALASVISKFPCDLHRVREDGVFSLKDIANRD